ncbi:MAG: hypothetical protein ACD_68C00106G0003 [uncultured bacterium]|nr:MAG: hypothetical protein ACD_68C00106G0003 [uncultured bacterium]
MIKLIYSLFGSVAQAQETETANNAADTAKKTVLNFGNVIDPNQEVTDAKWFVITLIVMVALLLFAFGYYFLSEKPKPKK